MIRFEQLDVLLKQADVKLAGSRKEQDAGVWIANFDVQGKKQIVIVVLSSDTAPYISVMSLPLSSKLNEKTLEELPAETLRTLLRVSSEVRLAKVTYLGPVAFVTSECSTDSPTPQKLRNRMEAAALLAAKIDLALA